MEERNGAGPDKEVRAGDEGKMQEIRVYLKVG